MSGRIGSLFSGYGGLDMGVQAAIGGSTAWVSDVDPGACKILAHRYPGVPNIGDITKVQWADVEPVDVLTGGFPCQDVSAAGKRLGMKPGTRSGLWSHMAYAIDQLRPSLVVAENVRGLLSASAHSDLEPCPWCLGDGGDISLRALGGVLGDLADLGYDASWQGLRASDVGAPHGRFRVFVIAWPARDPDRLARTARGAQRGRPPAMDQPRAQQRTIRPDRSHPAADAVGLGGERRGEHRVVAGPQGASQGQEGERQRHGDAADDRRAAVEWGDYELAIRRWERLTRPSPLPYETGARGRVQLSAEFTEWLMGLPAGHVTQVPGLTRNEQLRALGNGVVPQQAAEALRLLLPDVRQAAS